MLGVSQMCVRHVWWSVLHCVFIPFLPVSQGVRARCDRDGTKCQYIWYS